MPRTGLLHPDGTMTVVDTNANGDTRVFGVWPNGATREFASIGAGWTHMEVVGKFRELGDRRVLLRQ